MADLPLRTRVTSKTQEPNDLIQTVTSTATRITNYGKTLISLNSTANKTFLMENPIPGVRKVIIQVTTSTFVNTVNGLTTTVLFNTSSNVNLGFDTIGEIVELEGRTTLVWDTITSTGMTAS
jgi:hypothetical protein